MTRHLDRELSNKAIWDVMILHYLGLDHIGHLAGPQSPLVQPKLDEMDVIVKRIYDFNVKRVSKSLHIVPQRIHLYMLLIFKCVIVMYADCLTNRRP